MLVAERGNEVRYQWMIAFPFTAESGGTLHSKMERIMRTAPLVYINKILFATR